MAIPEKATAAIANTMSEEEPIEKLIFTNLTIKTQGTRFTAHVTPERQPYNSW